MFDRETESNPLMITVLTKVVLLLVKTVSYRKQISDQHSCHKFFWTWLRA